MCDAIPYNDAMSVTTNKRFLKYLAGACVLGILAGAVVYQFIPHGGVKHPQISGLLWPNPKVLTDFSLQDSKDVTFNRARLTGKWTLMFFGYTHCPDVCPTTLAVLKKVSELLRNSHEHGNNVQVVFISVDPKRDTREHLNEYLNYFDPTFIGVSDDDEKLNSLTKQLGILYIREKPDADGNYLVDHTASILLIDPHGRLIGAFGAPHQAEDIVTRFKAIRDFIEDL